MDIRPLKPHKANGIKRKMIAALSRCLSMSDPQNGCDESTNQSTRADPGIASALSAPRPESSRPHCQITCTQEKDWWSEYKPLLEIVGIILLAVYTGYTIKMYWANQDAADAARSAADTAASALVVANRPWVGVEKVTISDPPTFEDTPGGLRATVKIVTVSVRNFGPSPALNVSVDAAPFDGTEQDTEAQFKRESALHCDRADDMNREIGTGIGSAGQIVFPQSPATFRLGSNGPAKERGRFVELIGCITYMDQFGAPVRHHTRFCFAGDWNNLAPCEWGQMTY